MLYLEQKDYIKMLAHCRAGLPNEACGLLGGIRTQDGSRVEKVYLLTNMDHSSEHFFMDPKEQFAAIRDIRANGYELLGNFHSHPKSPAEPSEEDKRLAYDSKMSYLIFSLMNVNEPVLYSYLIDPEKNVEKEELIIESLGKVC